MPLPTGLRREPSGTFHLRIGVPKDVQPYWPPQPNGKLAVDAFRESLRTEDRADAIAQAHKLIAEYHERFASIRDQHRPRLTQLTPKLVAHLREQIKHELLDGDDIRGVIGVAVEAIPFDLRGELRQELGESMGDELTDAELLRFWADSLKQAHAQGGYGMTQGFVNMILRDMGLPPADWTQQAAALAVLGRTLAGAYEAIAQRAEGELIETPDAPTPYIQEAPIEPEVPATPAPALRSVVPDWKRLNDSNDEAVSRMNKALSLWEDAVGALPIDQITKATGGKFVLYLLDEEARKFGDKTAANHASNISALMNVAAKLGIVDTNPLDLTFPVNDSEKRKPWTADELKLLHGTPVTGDQPELVDPADANVLMSMLLWSGARIGEIAALRVQDIEERDGIWAAYIRLETTKKARHGDKDVSVRWLPLASAIRQQVLDHVKLRKEAGHTALFPTFNREGKVTPTDKAGRWFLEHRKRLGLPSGHLGGTHKWRHTVRTKLAGEGLGEALLDAVTGHQAAGGSAGRKNYTHADMFPLPKVLEAIERLAWPWPSRA